MSEQIPLISVIVPCRNEIKYIRGTISSLLEQQIVKDGLEIIIVDGMSDDGTKEILEKYSKVNSKVKVIDNLKKATPFALNIGIDNASGKFICIMGAHSEYSPDYLANCIKLMDEHPDVSCVGGPIISKGTNSFSEAAALAMSSYIGVGNAKHRFPEYEGYGEAVCFPMFRRNVFDKLGLYDETLIKNQDDEFFFRLKKSGGKIYLSPSVKSVYFVRNSPGALFKQYFQYGYFRVAVLWKHKALRAFRQIVPSIFFLLVFSLIAVSLISRNATIGVILPLVYIVSIIFFSIKELLKNNICIAYNFLIAVIILHVAYATGFFACLIRLLLKKKF